MGLLSNRVYKGKIVNFGANCKWEIDGEVHLQGSAFTKSMAKVQAEQMLKNIDRVAVIVWKEEL